MTTLWRCSKMQIVKKYIQSKSQLNSSGWEIMTANTLVLLSYHLAFHSLTCMVILQIDCVSDLTCFSLVQSGTLPHSTKYPAKLRQSGCARWAAITSGPYVSAPFAQWTVTSHSGKGPAVRGTSSPPSDWLGTLALSTFWYFCLNTDFQGCPQGWRRLRWTHNGLA